MLSRWSSISRFRLMIRYRLVRVQGGESDALGSFRTSSIRRGVCVLKISGVLLFSFFRAAVPAEFRGGATFVHGVLAHCTVNFPEQEASSRSRFASWEKHMWLAECHPFLGVDCPRFGATVCCAATVCDCDPDLRTL